MRKAIIISVFLLITSAAVCYGAEFPLLRDENPAVRSAEAYRLGTEKIKEAVPALIKALGDEVPGVRINAIVALGQIGDEAAVDPLTNILNRDELPAARAMAAEALSRFEGREVKSRLLSAIESEDENVRISALKSLGETGGEDELDSIIRIAENDPEWPVREAAAAALGNIALREENAREKARSALNSISRRDRNERVKKSAGSALDKINEIAPQRRRRFLFF